MWLYEGREFTSEDIGDYQGFVYLITELETGMKYVGKKFFWSAGFKQVKGKKKRIKKESDWKNYFGSNDALKESVKLSPDGFKREILHLCKKKADCSYMEIKEQIQRDVLFRDDYYNKFIGCKIHASHLSKQEKIALDE